MKVAVRLVTECTLAATAPPKLNGAAATARHRDRLAGMR